MAEERRDGVHEVKLMVRPETVDRVLTWMRAHLDRDPHDGGVLEIKFVLDMPVVLRRMVEDLGLTLGGFSKYRLGIRTCGLVVDPAPGSDSGNAATP